MMFKLATVMSVVSMASAAGTLRGEDQDRRSLSYQKIALYEPGSQVTDHAAIDLDQRAMESQISLGTENSFENAKAIYQQGGHSKSFAEVQLASPLSSNLSKGAVITGQASDGSAVRGKAYNDYSVGTSTIQIQYMTTDIQESYVDCQVGALSLVGEANTNGCFAANGTVTVDGGSSLAYSYNVEDDNKNGRNIAGFSTSAESKMYKDCPGCPHDEYKKYYNYYGKFDYANEYVLAALEGRTTSFTRANNNFGAQSLVGRGEGAKKGSAYMVVYMYVLREFNDAVSDCKAGCINCNDDPVHAWDEGVAFYAGSLEVPDGAGSGVLLHELADKRSANYRTSGTGGFDLLGTAKVNYDLMEMFSTGNFELTSGNCVAAKNMLPKIAAKMAVPLIQGTMRYAYKVEFQGGAEKEKAEGAVFAAAVLPRLHACSESAASTVLKSMGQGSTSTSFSAVRKAFEDNHECLGITCDDIGGLWDSGSNTYFQGAAPCIDASAKANSASSQMSSTAALAVGVAAAVTAVLV